MFMIQRRFISTVRWSKRLINPYGNDPARKAVIKQKVFAHARDKGVDARGADLAIIKSPEHEGGTNPFALNHVTVAFKDKDGNHITTHHVEV